MSNKSQTSTEYLIILSVVIVIALIVVGVMGGIPSIGGNLKSNTANAYWKVADIGINNLGMSSGDINDLLKIKNNQPTNIKLTEFVVVSDGTSYDLLNGSTPTIKSGNSYTLTPYDNGVDFLCDEADRLELAISICYTNLNSGANYCINDSSKKYSAVCSK